MKYILRIGFQALLDRLTDGKRGLFKASKHAVGHGRDITWTFRGSVQVVEVRGQGCRDGKTVDETRHSITSPRTSANALHREANGVRILATLRSLALALPSAHQLNALRLEGFWSIGTEGLPLERPAPPGERWIRAAPG